MQGSLARLESPMIKMGVWGVSAQLQCLLPLVLMSSVVPDFRFVFVHSISTDIELYIEFTYVLNGFRWSWLSGIC